MKAMRMFPSLFLSRTIKNMKIYYMVKKSKKNRIRIMAANREFIMLWRDTFIAYFVLSLYHWH